MIIDSNRLFRSICPLMGFSKSRKLCLNIHVMTTRRDKTQTQGEKKGPGNATDQAPRPDNQSSLAS